MADAAGEFSFIINFARGQGDPRRIFESASLLIQGFEQLDDTLAGSVDTSLRTSVVLEDVRAGSLRVVLRTLLNDIDEQALKVGEWKKAIGPLLVRAKRAAVEALDADEAHARPALEQLYEDLQEAVIVTDVKQLPAYAPIHEGRLLAALDILQEAKRTLGPNDHLTIETEGQTYQVDLTKAWEPTELYPASDDVTEKQSEGTVILTIRKPDLLGEAKWQFSHGTALMSASIKDEKWLSRFHAGKIPLHSGDALRCKVRFIYIFDETGKIIEQKTEILKVLNVLRGPGSQTDLFED